MFLNYFIFVRKNCIVFCSLLKFLKKLATMNYYFMSKEIKKGNVFLKDLIKYTDIVIDFPMKNHYH